MNNQCYKLIITVFILLISGCAGNTKQLTLASGEEIVFPNGTIFGGASTAQATSLAEIFVNAHNKTSQQLNEINKDQQQQKETAEKALNIIEELSKRQGTGEITLFFTTGNYQITSSEHDRLVRFLDFLSRESHGRKVLLISIGSASAFGNKQHNQRLAVRRAQSPVSIVEKYLINIPYEFYKVYSTGDRYSPADISLKKQKIYQHTRIIAVYESNQIPVLAE